MKKLTLSRKYIAGLLVAFGLAGCSVFRPVGQENFDCSGKKSTDPYCRSIRGIDRSTVGSIPDTRFDKPFDYMSYSRYHGDLDDSEIGGSDGKRAAKPQSIADRLPHEIWQPGPVIQGAPVRAAPVIQKIWINRYVDSNDKLHQPTEIYQEVVGAQWVGAAAPAKRNASSTGANPYPFKPAKDGTAGDSQTHQAPAQQEWPNAPMPSAVIESGDNPSLSNPQ
jgi:conjugal transfer pilus assembly protein TraV